MRAIVADFLFGRGRPAGSTNEAKNTALRGLAARRKGENHRVFKQATTGEGQIQEKTLRAKPLTRFRYSGRGAAGTLSVSADSAEVDHDSGEADEASDSEATLAC